MESTTTTGRATQFRRPRAGRALAGVAAAIADRTGIGVGWVRFAFIVATFFGGLGILCYAIGWLTIPDEGDVRSVAGQMLAPLEARGGGRLIGAVLLAVAGLTLLASLDVLSARWLLVGGLAVLGVLLYRGEILGDGPPPPVATDSAQDGPGDAGAADPTAEPGTMVTAPAAAGIGRSHPRSLLGRLTIAAVLVAMGALGALGAAGVWSPAPVHFAAVALAVIGVGLVVGAFSGRARWLAVVGVLLLPFVLLLNALPTSWSSEVGDRFFAPTSAAAVGDGYRIGAGTLRIDLTDLDAAAGTIVAEVGAGELRVTLPTDRGAVIDAEVGIGRLRIAGVVNRGGTGLDERVTVPGPDPIHVDAATGLGVLTISWRDQ
jgi:phage shock protein PspC (stress-responsive transcriptional regulator)